MKASDMFTPEEIENIKHLLKVFNGKVVKIEEKEPDVLQEETLDGV
jgi:hypothetical protein